MKKVRISLAEVDDGRTVPTAGGIDARWQESEAIGDETPGGSNPTPDQEVVEEIGAAIGVTYADDEELRAGQKETERDAHRWELDPASSEDYAQRSRQRTAGPSGKILHMKHRNRA